MIRKIYIISIKKIKIFFLKKYIIYKYLCKITMFSSNIPHMKKTNLYIILSKLPKLSNIIKNSNQNAKKYRVLRQKNVIIPETMFLLDLLHINTFKLDKLDWETQIHKWITHHLKPKIHKKKNFQSQQSTSRKNIKGSHNYSFKMLH